MRNRLLVIAVLAVSFPLLSSPKNGKEREKETQRGLTSDYKRFPLPSSAIGGSLSSFLLRPVLAPGLFLTSLTVFSQWFRKKGR